MKIFQQEISDGLEHKLQTSASICYASAVSPSSIIDKKHIKNMNKSLASINDGDLYYLQSILVTTSWNKNDDIFDKEEVWAARNSPEDKPTNLEHDESTIIGHITSNWPITENGELISEETPASELPAKYHILTGSVIYKGFSIPELQERTHKLISEIEEGTKYVSMECLFTGFDYGLVNKSTGEYKVLARNEETAFLTKYLRAYGGVGEHQDYKIGRVLRNINFSGKGFVDKPANPDSIILSNNLVTKANENFSNEKNTVLQDMGVSNKVSNLNAENITMNSEDTTATVQASDCSEAHAQIVELQNKVVALEAEVNTKTESANTTFASLEDLKKQNEDLIQANEKLGQDLAGASEIIAAYKNQEEEMAKKAKKMKRVAALVDLGIDSETATSTADKFESLDDETFATMTSVFAKTLPPFLKKKEEEDKKEDKEEKKTASKDQEDADSDKSTKSSVDIEALDTVEVEDSVSLSIGGQVESAVETTRAALVEFISSRLGKKL